MPDNFYDFFDTHTIYIVIAGTPYKLNKKSLSKEEVDTIPESSSLHPIMVIKKEQFDTVKDYLLDVKNPFRITTDMAKVYHTIGFLSDEEYHKYLSTIKEEDSDGFDSVLRMKLKKKSDLVYRINMEIQNYNITFDELAENLDGKVSAHEIEKFLSGGKCNINPIYLLKICALFGIDISSISNHYFEGSSITNNMIEKAHKISMEIKNL